MVDFSLETSIYHRFSTSIFGGKFPRRLSDAGRLQAVVHQAGSSSETCHRKILILLGEVVLWVFRIWSSDFCWFFFLWNSKKIYGVNSLNLCNMWCQRDLNQEAGKRGLGHRRNDGSRNRDQGVVQKWQKWWYFFGRKTWGVSQMLGSNETDDNPFRIIPCRLNILPTWTRRNQ